jgi:hypothetical protein
MCALCMYVYVYVCIYIHIYSVVYVCTYTYIHTNKSVQMGGASPDSFAECVNSCFRPELRFAVHHSQTASLTTLTQDIQRYLCVFMHVCVFVCAFMYVCASC